MTRLLSGILVAVLAALEASASVTVRKTGRGPTGYEVDFRYTNATARRVLIGGGLYPFTDRFHTTATANAMYDPHTYRPGDFYVKSRPPPGYAWPYEMAVDGAGAGVWTYTTPLPSGTYSYAFLVDCDYAPNCTVDTGRLILDRDEPVFENVGGDQAAASFQVPFDAVFQAGEAGEPRGDFDFALPPAAERDRGTILTANYTSPGSIHPAPDVHDFAVYLPAAYEAGAASGRRFPVLYLSHGANGNGAEWQNLARVSSILDNLVARGHLEPTVVVMPSFYNLDASLPRFVYGSADLVPAPDPADVRVNYQRYLFPWIQDHYAVCREPACRAFAGLSLGGRLAYEMYVNATDYFGYYGFFSAYTDGLSFVNAAAVRARPALAAKGLFVACGLYDPLLTATFDLQNALGAAGLQSVSRITPFGSHHWNTWQDNLWWFGVKALWKPVQSSREPGRSEPTGINNTARAEPPCLH